MGTHDKFLKIPEIIVDIDKGQLLLEIRGDDTPHNLHMGLHQDIFRNAFCVLYYFFNDFVGGRPSEEF